MLAASIQPKQNVGTPTHLDVNQQWKVKSELKLLEHSINHIAGVAMFLLGLTLGPVGAPLLLLTSPTIFLLAVPISIALIKLGINKIDESHVESTKLKLATPGVAHCLSARIEKASLSTMQNLTLPKLKIQDLYDFGYISETAFGKLLDLDNRSKNQAKIIETYENDNSLKSELPKDVNALKVQNLKGYQQVYVTAKQLFNSFETEWVKLRDEEITPYLPRPDFSMKPRSAIEQLPSYIEQLAGF